MRLARRFVAFMTNLLLLQLVLVGAGGACAREVAAGISGVVPVAVPHAAMTDMTGGTDCDDASQAEHPTRSHTPCDETLFSHGCAMTAACSAAPAAIPVIVSLDLPHADVQAVELPLMGPLVLPHRPDVPPPRL